MKSNSGLSYSVGNHGRSQNKGVEGKAVPIPTQARKRGAALPGQHGEMHPDKGDLTDVTNKNGAACGGRGEGQSRWTPSTLEPVRWETLRKSWRRDTGQASRYGKKGATSTS